jgi:hypothetical protein
MKQGLRTYLMGKKYIDKEAQNARAAFSLIKQQEDFLV